MVPLAVDDFLKGPAGKSWRQSRIGILSRLQLSTTERIAATGGPACWLPMAIPDLRHSSRRHRLRDHVPENSKGAPYMWDDCSAIRSRGWR